MQLLLEIMLDNIIKELILLLLELMLDKLDKVQIALLLTHLVLQ